MEKLEEQVAHNNYQDDFKRRRKLTNLIKQQKKISHKEKKIIHENKFPERATNLTDIIFDKEELDVLNKGYKYAPYTKSNIYLTSIEIDAKTMNILEDKTLPQMSPIASKSA